MIAHPSLDFTNNGPCLGGTAMYENFHRVVEGRFFLLSRLVIRLPRVSRNCLVPKPVAKKYHVDLVYHELFPSVEKRAG